MQHVPYEQRRRDVVYIMDTPPRRTNGFGVAGLTLGILSFFTCGITAPLGLIFSLVGMLKKPRGTAFAGLVTNSLIPAGIVTLALVGEAGQHRANQQVIVSNQRMITMESLRNASQKIEEYRLEHDNAKPEDIVGMKMAVQINDAWGKGVSYEPSANGYTIRSAGSDQVFNTRDDVTLKMITHRDGHIVAAGEATSEPVRKTVDGMGSKSAVLDAVHDAIESARIEGESVRASDSPTNEQGGSVDESSSGESSPGEAARLNAAHEEADRDDADHVHADDRDE